MGGRGDTHCVRSGRRTLRVLEKKIIPLLIEGVPEGRGSDKYYTKRPRRGPISITPHKRSAVWGVTKET